MINYQVWEVDQQIGPPLPGDEAARSFAEEWEAQDLDNEQRLFLLPEGIRPPGFES